MQSPENLDLQRGNHGPLAERSPLQATATVINESRVKIHQGPLPSPEDLAAYNDVFPGCAERIVALAERQAGHRQTLESTVILANSRREGRGQWMAFVLCLAVIGAGTALVLQGRPTEGFAALFGPLVGLAALFLLKRRDEKRAIQAKNAADGAPSAPPRK